MHTRTIIAHLFNINTDNKAHTAIYLWKRYEKKAFALLVRLCVEVHECVRLEILIIFERFV